MNYWLTDFKWKRVEDLDRIDDYTTEAHIESECGEYSAIGTYVHGELVEVEDVEEI